MRQQRTLYFFGSFTAQAQTCAVDVLEKLVDVCRIIDLDAGPFGLVNRDDVVRYEITTRLGDAFAGAVGPAPSDS
jgi:hypothetical protein